MAGFTDRDYGDTRRPRRHRRFELPDPMLMPRTWVGRQRLAAAFAVQPDVVDRAKRALAVRLDAFCDAQGMTVDPETVSWDTWATDASGTMDIELKATVVPRTDGEWASIRAAIEEDQADREEATATAGDIGDRLDALRETVGVWTATTPAEVREALGMPSAPARDRSLVDRPPTTTDVRDRDYTR